MFIVLNNLWWTNMGIIRVLSRIPKGPALPEIIPPLIQFYLDLMNTITFGFFQIRIGIQMVFLCK